MWRMNNKNEKEFLGGKNSWGMAAEIAAACAAFSLDVEEELIAEEEVSCYNCRYRRWTAQAFACLKK